MNTIFKAIVGSQAYGTSTPTSDVDYKGVYVQDVNEILTFAYREQVDVNKDECHYEVRRFLQLLKSANPTMLELLYSPEDCIIQTTKQFQLIVEQRDKFLTKRCLNAFGGYAVMQIKKARGLDKKMNWEMARVERKTPMDFCYVYVDGKSVPIEKWLAKEKMKQEHCGLVALNHFRDCYALYYDYSAAYGKEYNRPTNPLGFHGIIMEKSNELRLSSVPKDMEPQAVISYNKDGYSSHCKDYKEYQDWLNKRNTQRYVDNQTHGQKIDGKNMLHCRRLLDMAIEIAETGTITVRRPNADYLLKIRRGEVPLPEIIETAEADLLRLNELFAKSNLPDEPSKDFMNDLLLSVRYASPVTFFSRIDA